MPDGDIQLKVTLNTEGVRQQADALRASVSKLLEANVGNKLDSNLKQIMSQMQKLSAESVKLETQMGDLDRMHLSTLTQAMQEIETEITNIERTLAELPSFAQNTDSVIREKQNLEELRIAYETLRQEKEQVMAQGLQGLGFADYDQSANRLNEINNELVALQIRFNEVGDSARNSVSGVDSSVDKTKFSFSSLGETIRNAFSGLRGHVTSSDKQINKLASSVSGRLVGAFNKVKGAIEKAFSGRSMKRGLTTLIKYTFGVRSLYFLFRKLRNAVKEGLQNLVQYHSDTNQTNKAITELRTSLLYLKNAWASAFAPIINYVQPLLTSLIDSLAEVGNAIARFVGALTGQSKVLNAVKVNAGDYAKSLNGVGSSAKKAKDRLASFDDLNILGKDSDAGGGGGSGAYTPDPNEMFEYVDAVSEFADMLKEAWANADFTEVGAHLKDKIVGALKSIKWEEVYEEAGRVGKSAGTFLNGLFGDPELWAEAGKAIAGGLNTITYAVQAFLEETAKIDFGGNFATFVNEVVKGTDWATAGSNISEFFKQINDNFQSFLETLDIDTLTTKITEFIESLSVPELALEVADSVITLTNVSFEFTQQMIQKLGEQLGKDLVIYVNKDRFLEVTKDGQEFEIPFTPTIDWKEDPLGALGQTILFDIGKGLFEMAGVDDLDTLLQMYQGLQDIKQAIVDIINSPLVRVFASILFLTGGITGKIIVLATYWGNISKKIEMAKKAITDFFNGIKDFVNNFLTGFPAWFEDTFGTSLQSIGDAISTFFTQTIPDWASGIGDVFVSAFEGIVDILSQFDFIALMKEAGIDIDSIDTSSFFDLGGAIALGILEGIGKAILVGIPELFKWAFDFIVGFFCALFGISSPSTVFEEYGIDIINGLILGIEETVSGVITLFDNLRTQAVQKWDELKSSLLEKATAIKDAIYNKFISIKDSVVSTIMLLKDNAVQKFMEFKAGIYNVFSSIGEIIKTPINGIISVIESFINKIIGGLNKFISKFSGISEDLSSVASEYGITIPTLAPIQTVTIPRLAQGAVIPPNKEFMAVLGDQSRGTNIEAPLDTIKQAVAEELSAQIGVLEQGFADVVNAINNKDLAIGDKEIGQANARYTNRQNLIKGTSF